MQWESYHLLWHFSPSQAGNYVKDHPISYFSVVVFSCLPNCVFKEMIFWMRHKIYFLLEAIVFLKCVLVIIPYNLLLLRFESCQVNVELLCCFLISSKYAITILNQSFYLRCKCNYPDQHLHILLTNKYF